MNEDFKMTESEKAMVTLTFEDLKNRLSNEMLSMLECLISYHLIDTDESFKSEMQEWDETFSNDGLEDDSFEL